MVMVDEGVNKAVVVGSAEDAYTKNGTKVRPTSAVGIPLAAASVPGAPPKYGRGSTVGGGGAEGYYEPEADPEASQRPEDAVEQPPKRPMQPETAGTIYKHLDDSSGRKKVEFEADTQRAAKEMSYLKHVAEMQHTNDKLQERLVVLTGDLAKAKIDAAQAQFKLANHEVADAMSSSENSSWWQSVKDSLRNNPVLISSIVGAAATFGVSYGFLADNSSQELIAAMVSVIMILLGVSARKSVIGPVTAERKYGEDANPNR